MVPEFGINCPVNWLISVVLPAPLGPMMACSSPLATSSDRLSVALMPPKLRTRFSTRSKGSPEESAKESTTAKPPEHAHDAAAREQHDQQQQRAHDQRPVFRELRQNFFQQQQHDGAQHGAEQRPHAA